MIIKGTELEKRIRDTPKYKRYLYNIVQGFSIVDSWNMAIWHKDYEEKRRKEVKK